MEKPGYAWVGMRGGHGTGCVSRGTAIQASLSFCSFKEQRKAQLLEDMVCPEPTSTQWAAVSVKALLRGEGMVQGSWVGRCVSCRDSLDLD